VFGKRFGRVCRRDGLRSVIKRDCTALIERLEMRLSQRDVDRGAFVAPDFTGVDRVLNGSDFDGQITGGNLSTRL
jgi:hypothetical protein